MSTILGIKPQLSRVGKPLVIVSVADRVDPIFLAYGQWTNKGYSEQFEAYVGGNIEVEYFQEGEALLNGDVARDSNIIVKDFMVQMDPAVLARAVAAEAALKNSKFGDAAAKFRALGQKAREEAAAKKALVGPAEA